MGGLLGLNDQRHQKRTQALLKDRFLKPIETFWNTTTFWKLKNVNNFKAADIFFLNQQNKLCGTFNIALFVRAAQSLSKFGS